MATVEGGERRIDVIEFMELARVGLSPLKLGSTDADPELRFSSASAGLGITLPCKGRKVGRGIPSPAIREEATQQLRNLVEQIVVKGTKAEPEY